MEEVRLKMFKRRGGENKKRTSIYFQIFLGVLLVIFSVLAISAYLGKEIVFPVWFFSSFILEFVLFIIGIVFVVEGFKNRKAHDRILEVLIGSFLIVFSAFPMLHKLEMLTFLPLIVNLKINSYLLAFLILIIGVYLIVDRVILLFTEEYS